MHFGNAIDELDFANHGKGVVVLIDEYDDLVAKLLDQAQEAERVRKMLADSYGQLKAPHRIFELKVGESAAAALEQVRRKGYDAPYRADERPVWLIGLNFDRETRQLVDTAVEAIDKK